MCFLKKSRHQNDMVFSFLAYKLGRGGGGFFLDIFSLKRWDRSFLHSLF